MGEESTVTIDALLTILFFLMAVTLFIGILTATDTMERIGYTVLFTLLLVLLGRAAAIHLQTIQIMKNRLDWYDNREGERVKRLFKR